MSDMSDIVIKGALIALALALIFFIVTIYSSGNQEGNHRLVAMLVIVGISGLAINYEQVLEWLADWLVSGAMLLAASIVVVGLVFWLSNRNNHIEI